MPCYRASSLADSFQHPPSALSLPRKRFNFTRFQTDRTEARALNSPISIEKDIARLHRPMQQSKAMRKPKPKRNSHNRLCFHCRRPLPGGFERTTAREPSAAYNRTVLNSRRPLDPTGKRSHLNLASTNESGERWFSQLSVPYQSIADKFE
jgi:hypothetical protein